MRFIFRVEKGHRGLTTRSTGAMLEKLDQQSADFFRLLLLDPMPGSLHQMAALHLGADLILHPLQVPGLW